MTASTKTSAFVWLAFAFSACLGLSTGISAAFKFANGLAQLRTQAFAVSSDLDRGLGLSHGEGATLILIAVLVAVMGWAAMLYFYTQASLQKQALTAQMARLGHHVAVQKETAGHMARLQAAGGDIDAMADMILALTRQASVLALNATLSAARSTDKSGFPVAEVKAVTYVPAAGSVTSQAGQAVSAESAKTTQAA